MNIFKAGHQPGISKVNYVEMTAKAGEIATHNQPKKYQRKRVTLDTVDVDMKNRIRRIVYSFYFKSEPPSVQKILTAVNETENLVNFKITTFRMILKELHFRYQK